MAQGNTDIPQCGIQHHCSTGKQVEKGFILDEFATETKL